MTPTAGTSRWSAVALLATGALAFALSIAYQSSGVNLSPDGWAYWEGSVSLLRGDGYRFFGGQPITLWPPLFPAYLALWQALFGIFAGTLAIAQAAALGGAALLWGRLLLADRSVDLPALLALPALAVLLALAQRELGSESLFQLLLGAMLGVVAGWRESAGAVRWLLLTLLIAALLVTRNAALALLPGALWLSSAFERDGGRRGAARSLLAAVAAVAIWLATRALLGQTGSHALVRPDLARFAEVARGMGARLVEEAGPARFGLGSLLLAGHLLLAALLAVRVSRGGSDASALLAVRLLVFSLLSLAGFVLLVPVASPLEDRFGRFALFALPLFAIVPALAARSRSPLPLRLLAGALLLATVGVQARRAVWWTTRTVSGTQPEGLAWSSCLQSGPTAGRCLAPPDYPWIDRHYREHRLPAGVAP